MFFQIILAASFSGVSLALTEEDMEAFGSENHIETNTGLQGYVYVHDDGDFWNIVANGIPDHDTGTFPARGNPNSIEEQSLDVIVPKFPEAAAEPTCLPLGRIGIAVNGVAFYNPWTSAGLDAVDAETFDLCDGHPNRKGVYHYHKMPSSCLFTIEEGVPSPLIGVAFDGYGIYGPIDEDGNTLTSADLDECHGRYNSDGVYQYHATSDFPYVLGCFTGSPYNIPSRLLNADSCHFAADADPDTNAVEFK